MTRVSIHIDETNPSEPKAVLTVNGQSMSLSEREFMCLYNEMWWACDHLKHAKKNYHQNLAYKYKEKENVKVCIACT